MHVYMHPFNARTLFQRALQPFGHDAKVAVRRKRHGPVQVEQIQHVARRPHIAVRAATTSVMTAHAFQALPAAAVAATACNENIAGMPFDMRSKAAIVRAVP